MANCIGKLNKAAGRKLTDDEVESLYSRFAEAKDALAPTIQDPIALHKAAADMAAKQLLEQARGVLQKAHENIASQVREKTAKTETPAKLEEPKLSAAPDVNVFHKTAANFYTQLLSHLSGNKDAPATLKKEIKNILSSLGVKDDKSGTALSKWNKLPDEQKAPLIDKFAKGYEDMLFKGSAPSEHESALYQPFKSWLLQHYQSLKEMGVKLSPEVKAVYDRLNAAEKAAQDTEQQHGMQPLFTDAQKAGMSGKEFADYNATARAAHDLGSNDIAAKALDNMKWLDNARSKALKAIQKVVAGIRKGVRDKVATEVSNEPIYRARDLIKENTGPDGKVPSLDYIADQAGFSSVEEMGKADKEALPLNEEIKRRTNERMIAEHGATLADMQKTADAAVHNDLRLKVLAQEYKALKKETGPVTAIIRSAKEVAAKFIGSKKIRDLLPGQFTSAETRAGENSFKAFGKGDVQEAARQKENQILNNQFAKAVMDGQAKVQKGLDYFNSMLKKSALDKMDIDIREQFTALMDKYDLRKNPSNEPTAAQTRLETWINSQRELGSSINLDDAIVGGDKMHYKDMTLDQFNALHDAVKAIVKLGRDRQYVMIDGIRMERQAVVNDMVAKMKERGDKFTDQQIANPSHFGIDPIYRVALDKIGAFIRAAGSQLNVPHFKHNKFDVHEILGPFRRAIFEPLFNATYHYMDMQAENSALMRDVAKQLGPDFTKSLDDVIENHSLMDHNPDLSEPVKRRLSRAELIIMAVHYGNESNFDKVTKGNKWSPEEYRKVLDDNMRKEDWIAARTIGKTAGARWAEMEAMNRELGNTMPIRIEPRPFMTKFGMEDGWYAPVRYDPMRSELGKEQAKAAQLNSETMKFDKNYWRADTTTNGSLNARTNYHDFVDLDHRSMEKAINDGIRDLAYRKALIDVHKLITHPDFRRQFLHTFGREEYDELNKWHGRLANADNSDEKGNVLVRIAATARRAMVANGIAWRITTVEKHGGSAGAKSLAYFAGGGEKYLASRMLAMAVNHSKEVEGALAKFPEIRARLQRQDRDFSKPIATLLNPESIHSKAERFGHAAVAFSDFLTAVPTAHAAYDWAITDGIPQRLGGTGVPMSHEDAVKFANGIVREAHGTSIESDRSNLLNTRSEMVKQLTMLFGFMNNAGAQHQDMVDKLLHANGFGKPELLARYMMAQIAPALLAYYVTDKTQIDGEPLWKWFINAVGKEFSAYLPMGREAYSSAVEGFNDSSLPPWFRAYQQTYKVAQDAAKAKRGEEVKHPIKDVGNAAGLLIPGLGQLGASIQFLYDAKTGKQSPQTVGDFIQGLTSGDIQH